MCYLCTRKRQGALVQLVRIHACHAWGHGFESRTHRLMLFEKSSKRALSSAGSERLPYKQRVGGSNPSAPTFFQTAIHRKMDSCLFVHERNGGGWGNTRKLGGRLCAKPASTGCAVVCFCVGMSDGCSFSCERVCAVVIGIWCLLLEKPIDEWRCCRKKTERKREKMGDVEHFSPAFYPTFCTTAYSSL